MTLHPSSADVAAIDGAVEAVLADAYPAAVRLFVIADRVFASVRDPAVLAVLASTSRLRAAGLVDRVLATEPSGVATEQWIRDDGGRRHPGHWAVYFVHRNPQVRRYVDLDFCGRIEFELNEYGAQVAEGLISEVKMNGTRIPVYGGRRGRTALRFGLFLADHQLLVALLIVAVLFVVAAIRSA